MGRRFSENGVVCVCVDYRNYPQSRVVGMLEDVRDALIWTKANIATYGGDPDRIWLVGQVLVLSARCCFYLYLCILGIDCGAGHLAIRHT